MRRETTECLCGGRRLVRVFHYKAPPVGETRFPVSGGGYDREVVRCESCGHYLSRHDIDLEALYSRDYISSTYGDAGLARTFERIIAMSPDQSDNEGRVQRVLAYARERLPRDCATPHSVLDVGSGLCVFLYRMKAAGWRGTAVDPDPRAVRHARERCGVEAVCADFMATADLGRFDVVTLNKVLEHVPDPVEMLVKARCHVCPGGFLYLELPDGEMAATEGAEREEFFIEHHHIFSAASVAHLVARAGFRLARLERLHEPSTKYTLAAFLVPTVPTVEGRCVK